MVQGCVQHAGDRRRLLRIRRSRRPLNTCLGGLAADRSAYGEDSSALTITSSPARVTVRFSPERVPEFVHSGPQTRPAFAAMAAPTFGIVPWRTFARVAAARKIPCGRVLPGPKLWRATPRTSHRSFTRFCFERTRSLVDPPSVERRLGSISAVRAPRRIHSVHALVVRHVPITRLASPSL